MSEEFKAGFKDVWKALVPDKFWSKDGAGRLCGGISYILIIDINTRLLLGWMV